MSLDYAILGFLYEQPLSGYDLKKRFDQSVAHFWYADQSQIYRTLKRLKELGWISVNIVHQEEGIDKKIYSITNLGKEKLFKWMENLHPEEKNRSAQLIQVFFSSYMSDDQALHLFEQKREEILAGLAVFDRLVAVYRAKYQFNEEVDRGDFYKYLTLECGIESLKSGLQWVESVIERIKRKQYKLYL